MSMNDSKLYLVLGCGDIGFTVASELEKLGKEPVIVVPNELMVEQLKWLGFRALAGDFSSPEVLREAGMAVRRLES
jgi:Trk K+ transport system NAD-binding subunit